MSKIIGGCLCGKVRYESTSKPLVSAACHCTHCRKQSGTAYSVIIGVASDSLAISGGDLLSTFNDTGSSGQPVERNFCSACGSPLFSRGTADDILYIKAGSLDDSDWVKPNVEIWCNSQVSWSTLNKDMASFPTSPRAR